MPDNERDELLEAVQALTVHIQRMTAQQRDWRLSLRNGVLAGLGGVLGATVIVSLAVYILKPFERFTAVGSMIERLDHTIKQSSK